jgi:cardiolipin synthase
MPRWVNLANLFTLARLAMAPFIVEAILSRQPLRAGLFFGAAAATDGFDGVLARRFGWITRTGAYLDPIADKVLLSGVFLALAMASTVPWWFVLIIFGRDIFILAASLLQFPPSRWGKLSTFLQTITACAWMAAAAFHSPTIDGLAGVMLWPTAIVTVVSGIHYGYRGWRLAQTCPDPARTVAGRGRESPDTMR